MSLSKLSNCVIKTNKKNIIRFGYEQDKIFKKSKDNAKFTHLVKQFGIIRSTIIFKIFIVKLADKYPKMLTPSVTLNFLESYYKDTKSICKENPKLNILL